MGILTALAQQNPNQMCFKHSVCIKHPMQTKCNKTVHFHLQVSYSSEWN